MPKRTKTPISRAYSKWTSMKNRCSNPNFHSWHNYGGRGIKVCDRWLNSFENFLEDMKEPPTWGILDRIDVNGNYEPSNCRWVTVAESLKNKRQRGIAKQRPHIVETIQKMKSTVNPKTGHAYTLIEIGKVLKLSKQGVQYYIRPMKGICHGCLRELNRE